jgi:Zn-dependent protease
MRIIFSSFFSSNIVLAVFNLIPAFPWMEGVLRALLSFKLKRHIATKIAARIGQFIAVGFIFLGFYSNPFLIFRAICYRSCPNGNATCRV